MSSIIGPEEIDLSGYTTVPYYRPGLVQFRTQNNSPFPTTDQGIYTCDIPDSNGRVISLNVGLYPRDFNGELTSTVMVSNLSLHTVGPSISSLTYDEDSRTLTCISTGSPPTRVVWMKDGSNLTTDGSHYSLSQTVTDRAASTYSNVLTVKQSAPGGVPGTYTCTVSNDLTSVNMTRVAVGESDVAMYSHSVTPSCRCLRIWSESHPNCWTASQHQVYDKYPSLLH